MTIRRFFASEHFEATWILETRLVRVTRLPTPFANVNHMQRAHEELFAALDEFGRWRGAVLVDLRAAPGRNDAAFEYMMKKLRPRMTAGFRRCGALVQTAVGALQVSRYARQDRVKLMVSSEEPALLAYLENAPAEDTSQFSVRLAV